MLGLDGEHASKEAQTSRKGVQKPLIPQAGSELAAHLRRSPARLGDACAGVLMPHRPGCPVAGRWAGNGLRLGAGGGTMPGMEAALETGQLVLGRFTTGEPAGLRHWTGIRR